MTIIDRYNESLARTRLALEEADTRDRATLAQFLDAWPYAPTRQTDTFVIVPDTVSGIRPIAWRLSDYRVSSVIGGSLYFSKR